MVMESILSDPWQPYNPAPDQGVDPNDPFAEDRRKQAEALANSGEFAASQQTFNNGAPAPAPQIGAPAGGAVGSMFAAPPPPPINASGGFGSGNYGPFDTTQGQNYIDAPSGSPRAQLEAQRQGESQYGPAGLALATALPIIGSGPIAGPLGIVGSDVGSYIDQRLGLPELPVVGGPFSILGGAIGGGTDAEAIQRAAAGARGAAVDVFRAAMPEPQLYPGLAAGLSADDAARYLLSQGVSPEDVRAFDRSFNVAGPHANIPDFPASYPSIPEGTMGSEFPDVVAASHGRIDPNSPAARMGAPLAYDPQFIQTPERQAADQAMRDLGVAPQAAESLPAPPEPYGRTFYDNPEVGPARLGLPSESPAAFDPVALQARDDAIRNAEPNQTVTLYHGTSPEGAANIRANGLDAGAALTSDPETARLHATNRHGEPEVLSFDVPRSSVDSKSWYYEANQKLNPSGSGPVTADEIRQAYENSRQLENGLAPGEITMNPTQAATARDAEDAARQAYINGPGAPARSEQIDRLIAESKPPDTVPLAADMPVNQQIAEARRLGLPDISGDLTRGTELTKQQATDLLQAHIDLENALKYSSSEGRATENIMRQNRELGFESRVAGRDVPAPSQAAQDFLNSPNGVNSALQREGAVNASGSTNGGGIRGGGNGAANGMGGGGSGANRPNLAGGNAGGGNLLTKAYKGLNDLAYLKFGGDISALRQTVGRSMNLLRIADTVRSVKATAASLRDAATGVRLNDGLKEALEAKGITPKMADWRSGADFVNRETGVSGIANKLIPGYETLNRGYATMINFQRYGPVLQAAEKNPKLTTDFLQHMSDYAAIETGRGTFGKYDKQIANFLGPFMTSARYAASWPERMAYLIPAQNVGGKWTLFGPTWREAVKDQGGMVATGLGVMALSSQLGAKVNYQNGDIAFGDHHYNIWGGGYGWAKMAHDVYTGTKNDKEYPRFFEVDPNGKWKGSLAEFFRDKVGPLPQETIALMKETGLDKKIGIQNATNFMSPDYWNKGVTGKNLGILDRAAQFATFLYVQDMAKAAFANADTTGSPLDAIKSVANPEGLKNAIVGGGPSFLGISTNTYGNSPLTTMREAVKNDSSLPEAIRGTDYKDLGPDAKAAVDKLAEAQNPDAYKQAQAEQAKNSDPVFQQHKDAVAKIDTEADQRKTDLYEALRTGKMSPDMVRQGREVIDSAARSKKDAIQKDPAFKSAVDGLDKSEVSKALSVYYQIPEKFTGADGKIDWNMARQKQNEFIQYVGDHDRKTANLLLYEVQTKKETTNPLDRLYEVAQPVVQHYFGDIKDTSSSLASVTRSNERRANPKDDALLNLLGYEQKTLTPQAAQILQQMRSTLPAGNAPAPVRSAVPAPAAAPPLMESSAPLGPNGRSVAEITGKPYLSDEERNWYFQSRGLPVPGVSSPGSPPSNIARTSSDLPPPTGARLPPVAPGEFKSDTASPQQRQNFIDAMSVPANAYSAATRIPPAVWAAMGASESNWGRAPSVFGIKGVGSAGGADLATHEILGGQRVNMNDQFAAYNNLDDAFHHFIDLTSNGRYANAWNHLQETGDWQGFLRGITDAGYATAKNWPDSIISLANHIEKTYPEINRR